MFKIFPRNGCIWFKGIGAFPLTEIKVTFHIVATCEYIYTKLHVDTMH